MTTKKEKRIEGFHALIFIAIFTFTCYLLIPGTHSYNLNLSPQFLFANTPEQVLWLVPMLIVMLIIAIISLFAVDDEIQEGKNET